MTCDQVHPRSNAGSHEPPIAGRLNVTHGLASYLQRTFESLSMRPAMDWGLVVSRRACCANVPRGDVMTKYVGIAALASSAEVEHLTT